MGRQGLRGHDVGRDHRQRRPRGGARPLRRRLPVIRSVGAMVATAAVVVLAACHGGGDDWSPEEQFAPSLRPAFGARVTDGQLRIWTGSPCAGVTRLALTFDPDEAELVLTAPHERPATVEHLTLGGPYPELTVADSLPAGFD